jgi:3-hydroxyacyl-[acyl-carrier-protein] dehydratase
MSREINPAMPEISSRSWLPIEDVKQVDGHIKAKALFPPSSQWFQGHFPIQPILPGVAVLALAVKPLLITAHAKGRSLKVLGFSKVRIRMLTLPGDSLQISIEDMPMLKEAELGFLVSCRGEKVCQGIVHMAEE